MASASVVGQNPGPQHRLDSEPPLLFLKFVNVRKKMPRKPSLEKITLRKYSGTVETGGPVPTTAEGAGRGSDAASLKLSIHHHSDSPALAGETARGSASPSEGCAAPRADAPRSVDGDGGERTDCDSGGPESRTTPARRESQRGQSDDRNQNMCDCFLSQNTRGEKRNSHKRTAGISVMPGALAANGHAGAHSDVPHGKRASPGSGISGISGSSSSSNNNDVSMGSPDGEAGGRLPVERLTQGRTGVVRFARPEPQRREAWAIFSPEMQGDPRVKAERGEGHRFDPRTVTQDWCDACNCQISARTALKCQNCSYTCHQECESHVQLDCNQKDKRAQETPLPRSHSSIATKHKLRNEVKTEEEGGTKALSEEEVQTRIAGYNAQISENVMKLGLDGCYTGFIKVHLRLSRPVTVTAVEGTAPDGVLGQANRLSRSSPPPPPPPPPAPEGPGETTAGQGADNRTSFYLPSDCVMQLHISSTTTAREVIQGLLKKYMVLDNPRKFALYKQTHREGQALFQKLPLCECPLLQRLMAGPDPKQLSFVLKENETGEVEWHAFSVPELQNFLVILEKEEGERVRTVEQRYSVYRQKLQQALRQHDP